MKRIRWFQLAMLLTGATVALATSPAEATGWRCRPARCAPITCGPVACGGHYEYRTVEKTVYVKEMTTATRTVQCVEYRPEVRERTVQVSKHVPYTETVTRQFTVMKPEVRTKTVAHTVCKPVYKDVTQTYTVMVPHQEVRSGVRNVPQCVPVQVLRTVCRDRGHWADRTVCCTVPGPCGCGVQTLTRTCKVWVPNIVHEQVPVTVMRTTMVQQPFQYTVTVCRPETRTRTVRVCQMVTEQQTREVQYTVCVPEQRSEEIQVTRYRCEVEQRKVQYTVMVPVTVEKQVRVPVCRMVPKTVTCQVPVWVPGGCATCTTCP